MTSKYPDRLSTCFTMYHFRAVKPHTSFAVGLSVCLCDLNARYRQQEAQSQL